MNTNDTSEHEREIDTATRPVGSGENNQTAEDSE